MDKFCTIGMQKFIKVGLRLTISFFVLLLVFISPLLFNWYQLELSKKTKTQVLGTQTLETKQITDPAKELKTNELESLLELEIKNDKFIILENPAPLKPLENDLSNKGVLLPQSSEIVQQGKYGTASVLNGEVRYIPKNFEMETDLLIYKVCNSNKKCGLGLIEISQN